MKSLNVRKGNLISEVRIPSSKSYANRALILSAIHPNTFTLRNIPQATDVTILKNCLKEIGLSITEFDNSVLINDSFPQCESGNKNLDVGEGGTTARFLATMLLLGKCRYQLRLGDRLKDRPWNEFLDLAKSLGAFADLDNDILTIQGPVEFPSELKIDCSKTTQFATAFHLLSLVREFKVIPENLASSLSYWEMTNKLLSEFKNKDLYDVPLDWSSASYPMAFAALNQTIFFPGLYFDPLQADAKIFGILSELGSIELKDDGILVKPRAISKSFHLDVSDCLDLVPTLGYLLAHIEGEHKLTGFQNLVHKESDRLSEVIRLLRRFDRSVIQTQDTIVINGTSKTHSRSENLQMPNDHRMVMAGTLFLLHHAGGTIEPAEAVTKSYPDFFSILADC